MRRRSNPDEMFSTQNLLLIGLGLGGAYLIYQLLKQGAQTVTAPIAGTIANFWVSLTIHPMPGVSGDVITPDGTDVGSLSGMQVRTDTAGNVYVMLGSDLYQLGQSDINGNWPAQLVLEPDFGVTNSSSWG